MKSPKKCCELDEIVDSLRVCLTDKDMPAAGGNRPLRACGTVFLVIRIQLSIAWLIDTVLTLLIYWS